MWTNMVKENIDIILIFKKYSYNCGKYHCEIPKKCYFWLFVKIFKDHTYYMMRKGKYKTLCYVTLIIIVTCDFHII